MQFRIYTALASLVLSPPEMAVASDQITAIREASPDTFSIVQVNDDGSEIVRVAPRAATPPAPPVPVSPIVARAYGIVNVAPSVSDAPKEENATARGATYSSWEEQTVNVDAKERIDAQHAALASAGITAVGMGKSSQAYANGTRMAEMGYATQAARAAEHAAMMPLHDAARALADTVRREARVDVAMTARDFGRSIVIHDRKLQVAGSYALTERAIRGLLARIDSPALGYVLGLRERIADEARKDRDKRNVASIESDRREIARTLAYECDRVGDVPLKLRARGNPCDVFAIVSPTYAPADAPESVGELLSHLPSDVKGSWTYDPTTTSWELRAAVWTPTPVEQQAVGEAFEGYASFRGRDNGTGRWNGGGGCTFLRCLNASTYTAEAARVSRIHRGRVLDSIDVAVKGAMQAISALCQAWGVNRETVVELPTVDAKRVTIEDAIPGFYRALLADRSSELAKVPLRGRREDHAQGLARAYFGERRDADRIVRADLANGWTKYAQSLPADTRGEAEAAIGDWLARVAPVPYAPAARA